jgi:hypothetical protein
LYGLQAPMVAVWQSAGSIRQAASHASEPVHGRSASEVGQAQCGDQMLEGAALVAAPLLGEIRRAGWREVAGGVGGAGGEEEDRRRAVMRIRRVTASASGRGQHPDQLPAD